MRRSTTLLLAALLLGPAASPLPRALADDPPDPMGAAAGQPADSYEQTDRKKIMSVKLPRTWKALGGDKLDPKAIATFGGPFGADEKTSPQGEFRFYVEPGFARATLARAMLLPRNGGGKIEPDSLRQGPGWAEGCVYQADGVPLWFRYIEKNGRVYVGFAGAGGAYSTLRPMVEAMLNTVTVPGEYAGAPLDDTFVTKKIGGMDVTSDASPDRRAAVERLAGLLETAREPLAKALPGKPFDPSRPAGWIFQNVIKYEDRAKAATGVAPDAGLYNAMDHASMVKMTGEHHENFERDVYRAGAQQYTAQYFGGLPPLWLDEGLSNYAYRFAEGGGKGKFTAEAITKAKAAAAAGKRRIDQWFDVKEMNEVVDTEQGRDELFAWQVFFRTGKGSKKYRKQFDGYIAALRETGDPAAAKKAFEGANFDEMLQEFKAWAADWK